MKDKNMEGGKMRKIEAAQNGLFALSMARKIILEAAVKDMSPQQAAESATEFYVQLGKIILAEQALAKALDQ